MTNRLVLVSAIAVAASAVFATPALFKDVVEGVGGTVSLLGENCPAEGADCGLDRLFDGVLNANNTYQRVWLGEENSYAGQQAHGLGAFQKALCLTSYRIYKPSGIGNADNRTVISWRVEGSIDGISWNAIDVVSDASYGSAAYIERTISFPNGYTAFRWVPVACVHSIAGQSDWIYGALEVQFFVELVGTNPFQVTMSVDMFNDSSVTLAGTALLSGAPQAGATVRALLGPDAASLVAQAATATTDASGNYLLVLDGLVPQTAYYVQASASLAGQNDAVSFIVPFTTRSPGRTLGVAVGKDAQDRPIADLTIGAGDIASLYVAYGATDGGFGTNGWDHVERIDGIAPQCDFVPSGETSYCYYLPQGWGNTVSHARFFLYDGLVGTPYDTQYECLRSTSGGCQWIDTEIYSDRHLCITIDHQPASGCPFGVAGHLYLFGNGNGGNTYYGYTAGVNGTPVSPAYSTARRKITLDPTGFYIDGENNGAPVIAWDQSKLTDETSPLPIYLFVRSTTAFGGTTTYDYNKWSPCDIYSCVILTNGVSARNYIPVSSNGEKGLYDTVSKRLFTNKRPEVVPNCAEFAVGPVVAQRPSEDFIVRQSQTISAAALNLAAVSQTAYTTSAALNGAARRSGNPQSGVGVSVRIGTSSSSLADAGLAAESDANGLFTLTPTGLQPDTLYYAQFVSSGATSDIFTFSTLGAPEIAPNVSFPSNVVSVSGTLTRRGAGVTSVYLDVWTVGGTTTNRMLLAMFDDHAQSFGFSGGITVDWNDKYGIRVFAESVFGNQIWLDESFVPVEMYTTDGDGALYTWTGGDGLWTNAAHWVKNEQALAPWPGSVEASISIPAGASISGFGPKVRIKGGTVTGDGVTLAVGDGDFFGFSDDIVVTGSGFTLNVSGTGFVDRLNVGDGTKGIYLQGANGLLDITAQTTSFRKFIGGTGNRVSVTAGSHTQKINVGGTSNVVEISGQGTRYEHYLSIGRYSNSKGNRLHVRDGAYARDLGELNDNTSFFGEDNVIVIDDASLEMPSCRLAGKETGTGNAIAFQGESPRMVFSGGTFLGRQGSVPLESPIKFVFKAEESWYGNGAIMLCEGEGTVYGNTVFKVDRSKCQKGGRIILFSARNAPNWAGGYATVIDLLRAVAELPQGCTLGVSSDGRTIYCDIPSKPGTVILVQ